MKTKFFFALLIAAGAFACGENAGDGSTINSDEMVTDSTGGINSGGADFNTPPDTAGLDNNLDTSFTPGGVVPDSLPGSRR